MLASLLYHTISTYIYILDHIRNHEIQPTTIDTINQQSAIQIVTSVGSVPGTLSNYPSHTRGYDPRQATGRHHHIPEKNSKDKIETPQYSFTLMSHHSESFTKLGCNKLQINIRKSSPPQIQFDHHSTMNDSKSFANHLPAISQPLTNDFTKQFTTHYCNTHPNKLPKKCGRVGLHPQPLRPCCQW